VAERGRVGGLGAFVSECWHAAGGSHFPLLANIYLHEVLDEWFVRDVRPRLRGRAQVVRYADDFVLIFEHERDARRVFEVLPKRFERYGLTLHPDKTRLLDFRRPGRRDSDSKGNGPGNRSFDFLGFTHYWGRSRTKRWVVKKKTASERFSRSLRRTSDWCRRNRHLPVGEQHHALSRKLRGHYAYYGVTFNYAALEVFRLETTRVWRKWLSRRSAAARRTCTWRWMSRLLERLPLPAPRIVHSQVT
jgi:hypothetical protein